MTSRTARKFLTFWDIVRLCSFIHLESHWSISLTVVNKFFLGHPLQPTKKISIKRWILFSSIKVSPFYLRTVFGMAWKWYDTASNVDLAHPRRISATKDLLRCAALRRDKLRHPTPSRWHPPRRPFFPRLGRLRRTEKLLPSPPPTQLPSPPPTPRRRLSIFLRGRCRSRRCWSGSTPGSLDYPKNRQDFRPRYGPFGKNRKTGTDFRGLTAFICHRQISGIHHEFKCDNFGSDDIFSLSPQAGLH